MPLFLVLAFCSCSSGEKNETTVFQTQSTTALPQTTTLAPTSAEQTTSVLSTTAQTTFESLTAAQTTSVSTSVSTTVSKEAESENFCTLTIDCKTIKNNMSSLKKGLEGFVTKNGYILKDAKVEFQDGETVFDVIKRACKENVCTDNCKYCQKGGIQIEYSYTPAYESYYIEGIHQLYEKSCGAMSGWLYSVNGEFPQVSSSVYPVKSGDNIVFTFTCDGGDDVGNSYVG